MNTFKMFVAIYAVMKNERVLLPAVATAGEKK